MLMVKKPDGGMRTVVDLRALSNAAVDVEEYPFPPYGGGDGGFSRRPRFVLD